jgi:hypothetical protein
MELQLYHFNDDVLHVSHFNGQDTDVLKMEVVNQVYAVFSQSAKQ